MVEIINKLSTMFEKQSSSYKVTNINMSLIDYVSDGLSELIIKIITNIYDDHKELKLVLGDFKSNFTHTHIHTRFPSMW